MAEEQFPVVYGLWNESIGEWFNPGTRKPYFPSREAALRLLPGALRQYSMGRWVVREYPLDISALDDTGAPVPAPARPSAA
jgi:hypothetical protein